MPQMITIGQIIDKTLHLYQKHFTGYAQIGAALFFSVPLVIAASIAFPLIHDPLTAAIVSGSLTFVNFFVALFAGYFVNNGFIFATMAYDEEKKEDLPAFRNAARSRLLAAFLQGLVLFLMLLGAACLLLPGIVLFVATSFMDNAGVALPALGMFLLFAGGVTGVGLLAWFSVIFPFAPLALIVQKMKVVESVKAAFALVRGRWWSTMIRVLIPKLTFGAILVFVQIVIVFLFFVLSAALAPATEVIGETTAAILVASLQQIAVTAIAAITTPVFVIADFYVFSDLVATRRAS